MSFFRTALTPLYVLTFLDGLTNYAFVCCMGMSLCSSLASALCASCKLTHFLVATRQPAIWTLHLRSTGQSAATISALWAIKQLVRLLAGAATKYTFWGLAPFLLVAAALFAASAVAFPGTTFATFAFAACNLGDTFALNVVLLGRVCRAPGNDLATRKRLEATGSAALVAIWTVAYSLAAILGGWMYTQYGFGTVAAFMVVGYLLQAVLHLSFMSEVAGGCGDAGAVRGEAPEVPGGARGRRDNEGDRDDDSTWKWSSMLHSYVFSVLGGFSFVSSCLVSSCLAFSHVSSTPFTGFGFTVPLIWMYFAIIYEERFQISPFHSSIVQMLGDLSG